MPRHKDLKRLVRSRMQKTSESYTTARARLLQKKHTGSGSAEPSAPVPVPEVDFATRAGGELEAADLDADDDLDVVMSECLGCPRIPTSSRRVFIVENAGSPLSPVFQVHHVIVVDPGPQGIAVSDFDGDGHLDLAVDSSPVNVLLGNGDLTFTIATASGVPATDIAAADFDGDGDPDLSLAIAEGVGFHPGVAVLLRAGDGTFQPPRLYGGSYSPDLGQITEIVAGDADGDGDMDIVTSNYASNDASYYENQGGGTFMTHVRYGLGLGPTDLEFADFTGDGAADLVAPIHTVPPLAGHVAVVHGLGSPSIPGDVNGDGVVGIADLLSLLAAWGPCPDPPADCTADVDGDGAVGITDLLLLLANWT